MSPPPVASVLAGPLVRGCAGLVPGPRRWPTSDRRRGCSRRPGARHGEAVRRESRQGERDRLDAGRDCVQVPAISPTGIHSGGCCSRRENAASGGAVEGHLRGFGRFLRGGCGGGPESLDQETPEPCGLDWWWVGVAMASPQQCQRVTDFLPARTWTSAPLNCDCCCVGPCTPTGVVTCSRGRIAALRIGRRGGGHLRRPSASATED